MLKNVLNKIISKIKKEPFQLDSSISTLDVINIVFIKFVQYARGKFKFKNSKNIFIGSNTKILFKNKIFIQGSLTIADNCFLDALSKDGIRFGNNVSLGRETIIMCSGSINNLGKGIRFGNNVGLSTNCFLGCAGGIEVDDDTIIGNFVTMHSENHNFFDDKRLIRQQGITRKGIKIGKNCWIGAKVTILDGVIIEDGCVIAAGSVLKEGIYSKNSIFAGVPAKYIKSRIIND